MLCFPTDVKTLEPVGQLIKLVFVLMIFSKPKVEALRLNNVIDWIYLFPQIHVLKLSYQEVERRQGPVEAEDVTFGYMYFYERDSFKYNEKN